MIEEIRAYLIYREKSIPLSYWRTSTGLEVDLILGDLNLAVKFKATEHVKPEHMKGLRALMEDQNVRRAIVVSLEPVPRKAGSIDILNWRDICDQLWSGEFV